MEEDLNPEYDITYKRALDEYKTLRKGSGITQASLPFGGIGTIYFMNK